MKTKLLTLLYLVTGYVTTAQTISIPDPIFEQVLISQEIDSDGLVNGQILTADALAVTELSIESPNPISGFYIQNLIGIEGFINLESLIVHRTYADNLNINSLTKLKYLDCIDNNLSELDLSGNTLLEQLFVSDFGDVLPMNSIQSIDLSNNPKIKKISAIGIQHINLKNGSNTTLMSINANAGIFEGEAPDDYIAGNVCIEVDDVDAANNNQSPYSNWTVQHRYKTLTYSENCALSTDKFNKNSITIYPNPATDILYIVTTNDTAIDKAVLYDISGRLVKEYQNITETISVSGLEKGVYMMQVFSGNQNFSQKVIIN